MPKVLKTETMVGEKTTATVTVEQRDDGVIEVVKTLASTETGKVFDQYKCGTYPATHKEIAFVHAAAFARLGVQ